MRTTLLKVPLMAVALLAFVTLAPAMAWTDCYYNSWGDYVCRDVYPTTYYEDTPVAYETYSYAPTYYSPGYYSDDGYYDRDRSGLRNGLIAGGVVNEAVTTNFHTRRAIRKGIVGGLILNEFLP